jgi:hypothetical protein
MVSKMMGQSYPDEAACHRVGKSNVGDGDCCCIHERLCGLPRFFVMDLRLLPCRIWTNDQAVLSPIPVRLHFLTFRRMLLYPTVRASGHRPRGEAERDREAWRWGGLGRGREQKKLEATLREMLEKPHRTPASSSSPRRA